jgi:hypothetical protein
MDRFFPATSWELLGRVLLQSTGYRCVCSVPLALRGADSPDGSMCVPLNRMRPARGA